MVTSTQKVNARHLVVFFLISLQVALISILAPSSTPHDGLTLAQLETIVGRAGSWEGRFVPKVATFTPTGKYTSLLDSTSAKQTVIFSTCSCDLEDTAARADRAERRGEKVSVVLITSPTRLNYYAKKHAISQRLLAMRHADLPALSGKRTPIELVTGRDGIVYATPEK